MLPQITLLLAAAEFREGQVLNAFEIVLIGFSFVFFILLILTLITSIVGKVFARISVDGSSSPMSSRIATATERTTKVSEPDMDNPHYIAVVAAAIHCAMDGRRHRIISIRPSDSSWAAEGRRQVFSSRKVR